MSVPPPPKKPWPMKWIVLAILLCIVPYTFLTLRYRKPGPAYHPYEDGKNRATTSRLLSAGFQRITLQADRPADPSRTLALTGLAAIPAPAPAGLPATLSDTLIDQPFLPRSLDQVTAAASTPAVAPYTIRVVATLPDQKHQLAEAYLYRQENDLVIATSFAELRGDLQSRTRDATLLLTIPANVLKPGRYTLLLAGAEQSQQWNLEVY